MVESPFEAMDLPYDPHETEETKAKTSAEGKLSDEEFEELLNGAKQLDPIYDMITKFIIIATGRLGLRIGELVHCRKDWIDFDEQWIEIPAHEPCDKGRDGGICGICNAHAKQLADYHDLELDDVQPLFWKAKTAKAARRVPFSFSDRCETIVTEFFDEMDEFRMSEAWVRRRLKEAAEYSNLEVDVVNPHELRATAANHHANTGMDIYALKSFMGWSRAGTAERYMEDSDRRTRLVMERFHSMDGGV